MRKKERKRAHGQKSAQEEEAITSVRTLFYGMDQKDCWYCCGDPGDRGPARESRSRSHISSRERERDVMTV